MTQHYARILDASIEKEMLNVEMNYEWSISYYLPIYSGKQGDNDYTNI